MKNIKMKNVITILAASAFLALSTPTLASEYVIAIEPSFDFKSTIPNKGQFTAVGMCSKVLVPEDCFCVEGQFNYSIVCKSDLNQYEKTDFVPWPWANNIR